MFGATFSHSAYCPASCLAQPQAACPSFRLFAKKALTKLSSLLCCPPEFPPPPLSSGRRLTLALQQEVDIVDIIGILTLHHRAGPYPQHSFLEGNSKGDSDHFILTGIIKLC